MAAEWFKNISTKFKRWYTDKKSEKTSEQKDKMDKGNKVVLIALCVIFCMYAISIVYPLLWLLFNSLKTKQEFLANPWPPAQKFMFSNYIEVFKLFNLGEMLINSLALSLLIPTASVFVTACVAYAVSKYKFPGRKALYFVAVAIMFIPTTGSLPITYRLMHNLQLFDTLIGMIIMGAGGFGFNFLIMHGIFSSISKTYAEAAKIDGAGNWRTFLQIMIPQAKTTLFAVWILGFIGHWNDYASAKMFYPSHETLAVGLQRVADNITAAGSFVLDYPKLFAAVIITVIPILIIFIACQRYIIKLNMGGGIKE